MKCLTEDLLLLVLDGGIAPNQVEGIHAHLAGCAACGAKMAELRTLVGDLEAPLEGDAEVHVQAIMRRLDEPRTAMQRVERRRPRWQLLLGAGVSTVAIAAGVMLFARTHGPDAVDHDFVARGSKSDATLGKDVGTAIFVGKSKLVRLTEGDQISANASLTGAYANVHPRGVHLLVFAVDAANTVHWLYPAYLVTSEDPPSVSLEAAEHERVFPTSVVLEAPAIGALRFVSIATESPLHVSDIEHRAPRELTKEALLHAFPAASVTELSVSVGKE